MVKTNMFKTCLNPFFIIHILVSPVKYLEFPTVPRVSVIRVWVKIRYPNTSMVNRKKILVGGIPTPLKNDGLRQLG